MELGSVAEFLSAFGNITALIAAGFAARAAIKSNRTQSAQLRRIEDREAQRQEEARRDQASKVAIWLGLTEDESISIRYGNASSQPVFDVDVYVLVDHELFHVTYSSTPPNREQYFLDRVRRKVLDAFAAREEQVDWPVLLDTDLLHCAMGFRDANDVWWMRDFSGKLVEMAGREQIQAHVPPRLSR